MKSMVQGPTRQVVVDFLQVKNKQEGQEKQVLGVLL